MLVVFFVSGSRNRSYSVIGHQHGKESCYKEISSIIFAIEVSSTTFTAERSSITLVIERSPIAFAIERSSKFMV